MIAFILLCTVFVVLYLFSFLAWKESLGDHGAKGRIALAVMLLFTSTRHFTHPVEFVAMMPPFIPFPSELVFITGLLEILGAIGLLIKRFQRWAGLGLAAMFIAIFPANINVAIHTIQPPGGLPVEPWYLWLRLAFQPAFIWWALWCSKPSTTSVETA